MCEMPLKSRRLFGIFVISLLPVSVSIERLRIMRCLESPMTIPEVTSEPRRRGRGGRRSGRRRDRQRKNELPGIETPEPGKKTILRQAIEQQQQRHRTDAEETTTTTHGDDRLPPPAWLPAPTGNKPSAAPHGDDEDDDNGMEEDWEASGNEGSDDESV